MPREPSFLACSPASPCHVHGQECVGPSTVPHSVLPATCCFIYIDPPVPPAACPVWSLPVQPPGQVLSLGAGPGRAGAGRGGPGRGMGCLSPALGSSIRSWGLRLGGCPPLDVIDKELHPQGQEAPRTFPGDGVPGLTQQLHLFYLRPRGLAAQPERGAGGRGDKVVLCRVGSFSRATPSPNAKGSPGVASCLTGRMEPPLWVPGSGGHRAGLGSPRQIPRLPGARPGDHAARPSVPGA